MIRGAPHAAAGRPRRPLLWALAHVCLALALGPCLRAAEAPAAPAILQEMRAFRQFGSVLYVAAHPDDENTQLIAYLARGRDYRTAYLSLTRGDGGQNILGPEFGDLLGLIRTEELLAARRVDGGQQFFSRARDFGYSKDYLTTLTKWDHQQVLSDVVRVIRTFRPDVVVTRFPPEPSTTHGHHTASAVLALEAFRLAGDPKAFPEQLAELAPWQPRRILWNGWFPGGKPASTDAFLGISIDGTDPVSGQTFATLAGRSRSMHRSQGFANFTMAAAGSGPRTEAFKVLAGDPASTDIMDGIDTTWGRIPGGAELGMRADAIIAGFDPAHPAASVPALLELRARLAALPSAPDLGPKRRQLDKVLQDCLGLTVSTTVADGEVVPGETLSLRHAASVAGTVPVRWVAVRYPGNAPERRVDRDLQPGAAVAVQAALELPANTAVSQPYWLREEPAPGMFRVADASLVGLPENPPAVPLEFVFRVGDQTLTVADEPVTPTDSGSRRLDVIPPVSLAFADPLVLFSPGGRKEVTVAVDSARTGVSGTLSLDAPAGWRVSPASIPFSLHSVGEHASFLFTVIAPQATLSSSLSARAVVGGVAYGSGRQVIAYPHIPRLLLLPPARMRAVSVDLQVRGRVVGYLPGAGDSTAASLRQMGYTVRELQDADLTADGLRGLDAVVIGVRAFNTRKGIVQGLPALFAYVQAGGTVVEQYNTPGGLQTPQLAPYDLKLSPQLPRFRVTDEASAVTLLVPDHPAFTTPNRIGPADFEGWVQERGLDFGSEWDAVHFTALLSCSDRGEAPLTGGLLVARYGSGYFVYTGLSFFRQLPAGVPGAYRLFANLVSLGR